MSKKIYSLEVENYGTIYVVRPSARLLQPFAVESDKSESERNWFGVAGIVAHCLVKGPGDSTKRYASLDELLDEMDSDEYLSIAPANSQLECG